MKNEFKKDLLATAADKNYINQAKQLFSSVYLNSGWKGDYMLLSKDIPDIDLDWFRKKGILVKKLKPTINKTITGLSSVIFLRFYLFTNYFKKWKNIIYLDSDIIVRAPLDRLCELNGFFATSDTLKLRDQFNKTNIRLYKTLSKDFDLSKEAFNSGVMAFSSNIIQEETFSDLINYQNEYKDICFRDDQSILNLYFYKKWKKLPRVYNLSPYLIKHPYFNIFKTKPSGIILHFFGMAKPWLLNSMYYSEWKNNLDNFKYINFNQSKFHKNNWSLEKIKRNSKILEFMIFLYTPIRDIRRAIGLILIFIKNKFPKLFKMLNFINYSVIEDINIKN